MGLNQGRLFSGLQRKTSIRGRQYLPLGGLVGHHTTTWKRRKAGKQPDQAMVKGTGGEAGKTIRDEEGLVALTGIEPVFED